MRALLPSVAICGLLVGGCGDGALTRDEAKRLLSQHASFTEPVLQRVDLSESCHTGVATLARNHPGLVRAAMITKTIFNVTDEVREAMMWGKTAMPPVCAQMLREQGSAGIIAGFTAMAEEYSIVSFAVTEKGAAAGLKENKVQFINVAQRTDIEITGLKKNPTGTTGADFRFKNKKTPLGTLVAEAMPEEGAGLASFQLYDDGWRLVNIEGNH